MPRTFSPSVARMGLGSSGRKGIPGNIIEIGLVWVIITICSWITMNSSGLVQVVSAFGSLVGAIILGLMFYFQITIRKEKGIIKDVLDAFVNSWEVFLKNQPQNLNGFSQRSVMSVLKKGANIRVIIMSKPNVLSKPHFREALEIADQIEELKTRSGNGAYGSSEPSVSKNEMECLVKRAKDCADNLGKSKRRYK